MLLRSGWSARATDEAAFLNADENGPHTPGPSSAGARWLATERAITGFGVETVGIDAGSAGGMDPRVPGPLLPARAPASYGLTQLQQLDRLPTIGCGFDRARRCAMVGGTGSPARVARPRRTVLC